MKKQPRSTSSDHGFTLVYLAVVMSGLLVFSGLAVDSGRAYAVKSQLTKAVDGAALGAARNLNNGDPSGEAARIFHANFPSGFMGTSASVDPTAAPGFFTLVTDTASGINTVTINASATLPTTFMRLGMIDNVTVSSLGQATRRMVDLSLVVDVSGSIGAQWPTVRDAARSFIGSFDGVHDRMSLITFSNGATVLDQMPATRGFDKPRVIADVPGVLPGGSTLMVEGMYRGWDELRAVPAGSQSSLRIIVLFTDGASNGVPGNWDGTGIARSLRTYDFPKNFPDPDGQTWDQPHIDGLYDTSSGAQLPPYSLIPTSWSSTQTLGAPLQWMPATTLHTHHRSSGIPTSFPLQTNTLMVNGATQISRRGLRNFNVALGKYPADVWNINNAARNVLEIISNNARNDGGDYPIRIYTIGMGDLVRYNLGTMPEKPEDILKRISNDITSPDFNEAQLEGKYFFAQTAADVAPAFQGIQNQILRLSR